MNHKNRSGSKFMKIISIAITIFILSSVATYAEDYDDKNFRSLNDNLNIANVELSLGDLNIKIDSLKFDYVYDHNKYYKKVYVNLELENSSDEDMSLDINQMFNLKDKNNIIYYFEGEKLDDTLDTISADGKLDKKLTFLITNDADDLKLIINANPKIDYSVTLDIGESLHIINVANQMKYYSKKDYIKSEKVSANFNKTTIEDIEFEIKDMTLKVAKDGKHDLLILDMEVKNRRDDQIALTSRTMFTLKGEDGVLYKVSLPELEDSLNGLIDEDHDMEGKLVFEIPKSENKFYLNIKPFLNKDSNASIEIIR